MSDLPSMPYFVDDYEAATAHLTIEEDGAYMRLLRLCWRTPGCSIPDDDAWIKRHMRVSQEQYDNVVAPLVAEFFQRQNGRVFSKRLKKEFEYAAEQKRKKQEAGRKGGLAKSLKNKETKSSTAKVSPEAKPKHADTSCYASALAPNPNPNPNPTKEPPISPPSDFDVVFDAWWAKYPSKVGKKIARAKFQKIIESGEATEGDLVVGLDRYLRSKSVVDGYVKNPATWLNQGCWEDEPYEPPPKSDPWIPAQKMGGPV